MGWAFLASSGAAKVCWAEKSKAAAVRAVAMWRAMFTASPRALRWLRARFALPANSQIQVVAELAADHVRARAFALPFQKRASPERLPKPERCRFPRRRLH